MFVKKITDASEEQLRLMRREFVFLKLDCCNSCWDEIKSKFNRNSKDAPPPTPDFNLSDFLKEDDDAA